MLGRGAAALLLITLLLIGRDAAASTGYEVVSAPASNYPLNTTGYRYIVLYMRLNVSLMHPYQYMLIHLATRGIYAYGYAAVYDPDTGPALYIVAGSQNSWYNATVIKFNDTLTLWMLLDTQNGTIYASVNGTLQVLNKTIPVNITGLDIEAGSVAEQSTPYMAIVDPLIAAATNTNVTQQLLNSTPPWNTSTALLNKSLIITNMKLPRPGGGGTGQHTVSGNATVVEEPPGILQSLSLALIAAGAAVLLAVYLAARRSSPRAHAASVEKP